MKFLKKFYPPDQWKIPVIILLGIFVGLGAYLVHISRAASYLSDEPETCINCHVMVPQYATWMHSSHREHTNCNDCHVPHDNFVDHYYFKAKDGLRHATIFTLRNEPQSITIKHAGVEVVQQNCIRCHEDLIEEEKIFNKNKELVEIRKERLCWDCHMDIPHGDVRSLSSTPNAVVPLPKSPVPKWLKKAKTKENKK
ncbi:MAG: cytochrome c nitrite reductase small subunit [Bacteroidota bacterium]